MRVPKILVIALAALFGAGLSACASMGGGGAEGNTTLVVENTLAPSTSLTIYALPEVGSRSMVGLVDPQETARLTFNSMSAGTYRFMARTTSGQELVSHPITVSPGQTIEWDVRANIVRVL